MKLNWNFQRGGNGKEGHRTNPFHGEIFCGTIHNIPLFTTLKIKARSVNLKIACVIHMDMHVHELLNPRGL